MRAASSDNIQAEAILACDVIGSTLVISTMTAEKVMHTTVSTLDPVPISFLKQRLATPHMTAQLNLVLAKQESVFWG